MSSSKPAWYSSPPAMVRYAVAVVAVAGALAAALWLQDHLVGAPVIIASYCCATSRLR